MIGVKMNWLHILLHDSAGGYTVVAVYSAKIKSVAKYVMKERMPCEAVTYKVTSAPR